jgi:hypothetical protein
MQTAGPKRLTQTKLPRIEAAQRLREKWRLKCSTGHLSNLAANGGGPPYHRQQGRALYPVEELDNWARRRLSPLLETSRDAIVGPQTDPGNRAGMEEKETEGVGRPPHEPDFRPLTSGPTKSHSPQATQGGSLTCPVQHETTKNK